MCLVIYSLKEMYLIRKLQNNTISCISQCCLWNQLYLVGTKQWNLPTSVLCVFMSKGDNLAWVHFNAKVLVDILKTLLQLYWKLMLANTKQMQWIRCNLISTTLDMLTSLNVFDVLIKLEECLDTLVVKCVSLTVQLNPN